MATFLETVSYRHPSARVRTRAVRLVSLVCPSLRGNYSKRGSITRGNNNRRRGADNGQLRHAAQPGAARSCPERHRAQRVSRVVLTDRPVSLRHRRDP